MALGPGAAAAWAPTQPLYVVLPTPEGLTSGQERRPGVRGIGRVGGRRSVLEPSGRARRSDRHVRRLGF